MAYNPAATNVTTEFGVINPLDYSASPYVTLNSSGIAINGVTVDATPLEINRSSDVSTRLVAAGGTEAITVAAHDGRTVLLDTLTGSVCTLPSATGTGAIFRFVVSVVPTSNSHKVQVTTTDVMGGSIAQTDTDSANATVLYPTGATSDTITYNGTTTGGFSIGDWIECQDVKAGVWAVRGQTQASGAVATPFSAAV